MKQRLAVAAALLREPEVLILDEPTSGLDPGGMRDVRALIRRLNEEGLTIFLSSHLLAEIEQLCDRVAVIGHGRLLAEGTIAEVTGKANGHPSYRLIVDDTQRALAVLTRSNHVAEAWVTGPEDSNGLGEGVRLSVGSEGVGPVVRELVADGVEVLVVVPARPSLEDLFLELTEGNA
jgi:ABC-2 type transport system ATP-binding protein